VTSVHRKAALAVELHLVEPVGAATILALPKSERPIPAAWKELGGADIAQVFIDQIRSKVSVLTAEQVQDLVTKGEKITEHGSVELKKKIRANPDEEIPVSMSRVRPGQSQISYDHVRQKLLELLDAIAASPKDVVTRFLAGDRLKGFLSPSGDITLTDGHHKFTALLALRGLVGMSMFGGTHVPMLFCEPRESKELFLDLRNGKHLKSPPLRFGKLENNPFRKLAADLAVKVRGEPGNYRLEGLERPLWIKGGRSQDFIEFHLARCIESALADNGYSWKPGEALKPEERAVVRKALLSLADQESFALDKVGGAVVIPEDWTKAEILEHLRIGRKKGKLKLRAEPTSGAE
jgi:hypothetical protein